MSSIITEEKTKEMLTEILIEMMQNKRELFYEIVLEALEDIGLANAITEGLNRACRKKAETLTEKR